MILLALLVAAPAPKEPIQRVTAAELSAHIRFISDDATEGRKPGTPGDELAIKYLAAELEQMGLRPAGDKGTFFQAVPLVQLHGEVPRDVSFKTANGPLTLHAGGGVQADLRIDPDAIVERAHVQDAP